MVVPGRASSERTPNRAARLMKTVPPLRRYGCATRPGMVAGCTQWLLLAGRSFAGHRSGAWRESSGQTCRRSSRSHGGTMRLWPSFIGLAAIAAGCGGSAGSSGTCQVSSVNVSANPGTVPTGQASTVTAVVTSTGSCSGGVAWSATPGGGTLTTNGATATFSSGAAATYTLTARSNDDTTQSGSTTVAVTQAAQCGVANGTVVTHSSNIVNSETWAGAGVTHMVPQSIAVDAPATVTIEPCAIVALGQGATITVRGDTTGNRTATLAALGTNDDTGFVAFVRAGGDAEGGSRAGRPTAGSWHLPRLQRCIHGRLELAGSDRRPGLSADADDDGGRQHSHLRRTEQRAR